jgi:uncharacterized protein
MTRRTAGAALELAASAGLPCHVQLAGGEPTLVPELVEWVITEIRRRRLPATIGIQTNATHLTPSLVRLFLENRVDVGVSVDGPPPVQETLRGHAADTFRGLALLRDQGVPVTVTTVLTSLNTPYLGYLALSLAMFPNVLGLALDPLVERGSAASRPDLVASPETIAIGVGSLHHRLAGLNRMRSIPVNLRELDRVRYARKQPVTVGDPGGDFCHACRGESLAVAPDGTCYPCSQAVGDPDLAVGDANDPAGIDWSALRTAYQGVRLNGPCESCSLRGSCPGDCPSRLATAPSGEPAMCVIYRTLAELERL